MRVEKNKISSADSTFVYSLKNENMFLSGHRVVRTLLLRLSAANFFFNQTHLDANTPRHNRCKKSESSQFMTVILISPSLSLSLSRSGFLFISLYLCLLPSLFISLSPYLCISLTLSSFCLSLSLYFAQYFSFS